MSNGVQKTFSQGVLIDFQGVLLKEQDKMFAEQMYGRVAKIIQVDGFQKIHFDFTRENEEAKNKLMSLFSETDSRYIDNKRNFDWIREMNFELNDLICKPTTNQNMYTTGNYLETTKYDLEKVAEMNKNSAIEKARMEAEEEARVVGAKKLEEEIKKPSTASWWEWVTGDHNDIGVG
jgi:hypothetical protein